jgi:hypothetical protein
MKMVNKVQPFRQHHISRALKAAAAAGMTRPRLELKLPGGGVMVIGDDGEPAGSKAPGPARKASGKAQPSGRRQP